jgi:hypothetical protein
MPYSAFGIDHGYEELGEIEKFSLASVGSKLGQATSRMGGKMAVGGARQIKTNPGAGGFGHMRVKAGGALRRLGTTMSRNPGATGGIAAGAGAGAIGTAGAVATNRRRY